MLQSLRRQLEKQTMLLAAAKLMTKEMGASGVAEVMPGGRCVDVGGWSFRRPVRNAILEVSFVSPNGLRGKITGSNYGLNFLD